MSGRPSLPGQADVVIVGGGVMGTSAAFFLGRESDLDVVLIERDNIAAGSTGDSSANIRHNYGDRRVYTELTWWSQEYFRHFEERTGQPIAYVECPRVRFGKEGTDEGQFIEAGHRIMKELGIPTRRLDRDELITDYPMFSNLEQYDFAITEDAAAYSDGTDVAAGFARAAAEDGVTVITGVEVNRITFENDAVTGVETSVGGVDCDDVVVAAGPWTPRLAADVGVTIPITPTREEVFILDPPQSYVERYGDSTPMTRFEGGKWYMRPDFNDGILVATHPFAEEQADPDHYDDTPDQETALAVFDLLAEHVPELTEARIRGQYCGIYSTTPDHDFIVDQAGPAGCTFAGGFSGHGFKVSPAIGKILRDLVVDGQTDLVDLDVFSLDRFDRTEAGHGQPQEPL